MSDGGITEIVEIKAARGFSIRAGIRQSKLTCGFEGGALGRARCRREHRTGVHEALELRDGDKKRYGGKGVLRRSPTLTERSHRSLRAAERDESSAVDRAMIEMDGTAEQIAAWRERESSVYRSPGRATLRLRPTACLLSYLILTRA